jgi:hypothetical protein
MDDIARDADERARAIAWAGRMVSAVDGLPFDTTEDKAVAWSLLGKMLWCWLLVGANGSPGDLKEVKKCICACLELAPCDLRARLLMAELIATEDGMSPHNHEPRPARQVGQEQCDLGGVDMLNDAEVLRHCQVLRRIVTVLRGVSISVQADNAWIVKCAEAFEGIDVVANAYLASAFVEERIKMPREQARERRRVVENAMEALRRIGEREAACLIEHELQNLNHIEA